MDFQIREMNEKPPMELLLLADPSRELVQEYIRRGTCFVAERKGQIIGVYVLLPTRPQTVELVNIAVMPSHQGKGIGKKLLKHAIQTAKSNSSIGQLAFYQKCGFRMIGIDFDFFTRHYSEAIFENGIQCRDMIRLSRDL